MNDPLEKLMFEELRNACRGGGECVGEPCGASRPLTECLLLVFYLYFYALFFFFIGAGGFLPAMKQIGNVAALPGIVHVSGCLGKGALPRCCGPRLVLGWLVCEEPASGSQECSQGQAVKLTCQKERYPPPSPLVSLQP